MGGASWPEAGRGRDGEASVRAVALVVIAMIAISTASDANSADLVWVGTRLGNLGALVGPTGSIERKLAAGGEWGCIPILDPDIRVFAVTNRADYITHRNGADRDRRVAAAFERKHQVAA